MGNETSFISKKEVLRKNIYIGSQIHSPNAAAVNQTQPQYCFICSHIVFLVAKFCLQTAIIRAGFAPPCA